MNMAKLEELLKRVSDQHLRAELGHEIKILKHEKRYGLVFEDHLPENALLYGAAIRPGQRVAKRGKKSDEIYTVVESVEGGIKYRIRNQAGPVNDTLGVSDETVPTDELIAVKQFGEPIYPTLVSVDKIARGEGKPFHTLINSENYHALQLLQYCCEAQVDVIYIDPPYNTGARDWKYNNDYVDSSDQYRHSKWLAMMKRRLLLAKRLLKPNGVMIITIDDNELHTLTPLLYDLRAKSIGRIAICIKPEGRRQSKYIMEAHEYALFVTWGNPSSRGIDVDFGLDFPEQDEISSYRWEGLMRRDSPRESRGSDYWFAFYVSDEGQISTESMPGWQAVWPVNSKGIERVWLWDRQRASENLTQVKAEIRKGNRITVYYKRRKQTRQKPTSFWYGSQYNANAHGTRLLDSIVPSSGFAYPKSLYSVSDAIDLFLPPEGLVLDFFAGSGTTFHAVCLLNAVDGGKRRCILVTNNEVDEEQTKLLNAQGYWPGMPKFEQHGICQSVTWPRCRNVVDGKKEDGTELRGTYLNEMPLNHGFSENIEYFDLGFLDPNSVARGDSLEAISPILWLISGACGPREIPRGNEMWHISTCAMYGVLMDENQFAAFKRELKGHPEVQHVFLVTDSEDSFREMALELPGTPQAHMLYKSYLDNFKINVEQES